MCEICGEAKFDLLVNIDLDTPDNPNEYLLACNACAHPYLEVTS